MSRREYVDLIEGVWMRPHLTMEQRQLARRLSAKGLSLREVARQVGCSHDVVRTVVGRESKHVVRSDTWRPGPGRLSLANREEISLGLRSGQSFTEIAARLGKATSTVSREVAGNGGRQEYRAWRAHVRARDRARRPKPFKLGYAKLVTQVSAWLQDWWSPQEIVHRLRMEFADDPKMHVSHETIYQSLFVQGRGELRRELARCLRTGRIKRRPRHRPETMGRHNGMVMISDRPAEVADRAVPGHWEGDLIIGKDSRSAVGTLVERTTRYVLLVPLPDGRDALSVGQALQKAVGMLPRQLCRSLTWDQGTEMARHTQFTLATGIPVYFCDPHSPWQRGSNENTNGLLRQYMPKGTDLSQHTAEDLARFAHSLNNRPRKTLGYMKPSERLTELLAHTG